MNSCRCTFYCTLEHFRFTLGYGAQGGYGNIFRIKQYEKLYHYPIAFLPTPHGLLPMKCTPEQYEQFQRDGNKLKIRPIDHGER